MPAKIQSTFHKAKRALPQKINRGRYRDDVSSYQKGFNLWILIMLIAKASKARRQG